MMSIRKPTLNMIELRCSVFIVATTPHAAVVPDPLSPLDWRETIHPLEGSHSLLCLKRDQYCGITKIDC